LNPTKIYIVGQNIKFDVERIRKQSNSNQILNLGEQIDTLPYAQGIKEYPYSLEKTKSWNISLSQSSVYMGLFGEKAPNSHNAYYDCLNLVRIINHHLFPSIFLPPPPKVPRRCEGCKKERHAKKEAKCKFYLDNRESESESEESASDSDHDRN